MGQLPTPVWYLHKSIPSLPEAGISHLESHFTLLFAAHPQSPYTPTLSICRKGEKSFTVKMSLGLLLRHSESVCVRAGRQVEEAAQGRREAER